MKIVVKFLQDGLCKEMSEWEKREFRDDIFLS